jgi:putative nucleotidyltransferase with HDIG domain
MTGSVALVDLGEVIEKARGLEPLPASVAKIAALADSPDADLSQIADAVALDPALTLKVLRRANSASARGRGEVGSARDAVMRLGMGTVLTLATGTRVKGELSRPLAPYGLEEGGLWRHSVAAALAAENLRAVSKVPLPPPTFTAALLHDLGKLVLAQFISDEVLAVLERARVSSVLERARVESEVLGVNHAELGALVARNWELPESIVAGVMFHHEPDQYESTLGHEPASIPICHAVHVADVVGHTVCQAQGALVARPSEAALRVLGLDGRDVEKICARVAEQLDETVAAHAA